MNTINNHIDLQLFENHYITRPLLNMYKIPLFRKHLRHLLPFSIDSIHRIENTFNNILNITFHLETNKLK